MRWFTCCLVLLAGCGRTALPDNAIVDDDPPPEGDGDGDVTDSGPSLPTCAAGYVPVAANAELGTNAFCVMRFEAKAGRDDDIDGVIEDSEIFVEGCVGACDTGDWAQMDYVPVASPVGLPWRGVSQTRAFERCAALGATFGLISNREWMTIARSAEQTPENWSTNVVGSGRMVNGHINGPAIAAVTDPADPYSDTGDSASGDVSSWSQRRTLVLATGDVVWDLPGNVQEWVDWTLGDPLDGPPIGCASNELPLFTCSGVAREDYDSAAGTYDSTFGVGRILGGDGGAARRGGQNGDGGNGLAGIYGMNMNRFPTDVFPSTGFRCVQRPPP
jgi:hypothetical protein